MKQILSILTLLIGFSCFARVDYKCLVNYRYAVATEYGGYTEESEPKVVTVSFLSGAEYSPRRSSTEKLAIVWFSQTNCAVIKLDPKRITSVEKLTLSDLFDVLSAGGAYGEQINGGELDALGLPYRWYITLRDHRKNYDFVDERLRAYNERTGYSLYAL